LASFRIRVVNDTRDDLPATQPDRTPDYVSRHLEHVSRYTGEEYRARRFPVEFPDPEPQKGS